MVHRTEQAMSANPETPVGPRLHVGVRYLQANRQRLSAAPSSPTPVLTGLLTRLIKNKATVAVPRTES